MRDWKQYVREQLPPLQLSPEREAEIVAELAQHLEAAYEEALTQGRSEAEARAVAAGVFKDWRVLESELHRAERIVAPAVQKSVQKKIGEWEQKAFTKQRGLGKMLADLLQDLRYGLRTLRNNPGFTAVAVLTLALGIGANTAIFSVIYGVLLRPLPYPNPERLVLIWSSHPHRGILRFAVDPADFEDWRARSTTFDEIAIWGTTNGTLGGGDEPQRIRVSRVSPGFFRTLGVSPILGRGFREEENRGGKAEVTILSYSLWQRRYGGAPNILGKKIILDDDVFTVVGVLPQDFDSLSSNVELYRPYGNAPTYGGRGSYTVSSIGRLKPNVSLERAQADLDSITKSIAEEYPVLKANVGALVDPLHEVAVGSIRPALLTLLGAVGFVLLIACFNVAGLMLARSAARQKEIGIRLALGAGRVRIVRQLMTESLLLSLVGGAGGLLLAFWGVRVLPELSAGGIPRIGEVGIDYRVLGFTLGVSVLTGILAGILPAFRAAGTNLNESLKEGGRQTAASGHSITRNALVVAELALALVVLAGAGLLIRSFDRLLQKDPGLQPNHLLTLRIEPRRNVGAFTGSVEDFNRRRAARREEANQFYTELLDRIEALPGVQSVAATNHLPFNGGFWRVLLQFEYRPLAPGEVAPNAQARVVTPGYFETMGIRLLRGRTFTDNDSPGSIRAALVNETMARTLWPDGDPIGKRFTTGDPNETPWLTIIGVVGDIRSQSLESPLEPILYVPFAQARLGFMRFWGMNLVVRAGSDPLALVPSVRAEIRRLNKNLPVFNVTTMEKILTDSFARRRFNMLLLGVFAFVALTLAAVGIYGVMSYTVSRRIHEIGIRMALGAHAGHVFRMIAGRGMLLAFLGTGLGVTGAMALTRFMQSLLFEISPTDPFVLGGVAFLLLAAAFLACYIPARRAAKVDPMVALRYE